MWTKLMAISISEKNQLLTKSTNNNRNSPKMIPKPKGISGEQGYRLQIKMGLEDDKESYNDILVSPDSSSLIITYIVPGFIGYCP